MARHLVCKESDLGVEDKMAVKIEGNGILVYRLDDGFYATQSNCTHIFAPMKKGKVLDGCRVQCPFHRAEFDIRTGEVAEWANFPPGVQLLNTVRKEKALKTYPVEVDNGEVFVVL
jgi:nitrite reductase/ring-hydroxylating ferredoxin subunit